jgi:hypothetical protein
MAAVATSERPVFVTDPPVAERSAPRLFEPVGGSGVSFEDAILGVWEDLVAANRAECPVCGGRMHRESGCESCGSELS